MCRKGHAYLTTQCVILGRHIAHMMSCLSINGKIVGEAYPDTIGWAYVVIPPERHVGFKIAQEALDDSD